MMNALILPTSIREALEKAKNAVAAPATPPSTPTGVGTPSPVSQDEGLVPSDMPQAPLPTEARAKEEVPPPPSGMHVPSSEEYIEEEKDAVARLGYRGF